MKLTGAVNNAGSADQIEYFEEGRRHRTLTLKSTSVTDADNDQVFAIGNDGTDAKSDDPASTKFAQKNDVIMNSATGVRYIVTNRLTDATRTVLLSSVWTANR